MEVSCSGGAVTPVLEEERVVQVARTFALRYQGLFVRVRSAKLAAQEIELQMNDYTKKFSLKEKEQVVLEYNRLGRPDVLGSLSVARVLPNGLIAIGYDSFS